MNAIINTQNKRSRKFSLLLGMLTLIVAAAFLFPQPSYSDESEAVEFSHVLDFNLPEYEVVLVLPESYDKDKLFNTTVKSFNAGQALFTINGFELDETENNTLEIKIAADSREELSALAPSAVEYKSEPMKASDILRNIPSITTEDDRTIGVLIPPFAYFSKKF
jgi:hypothetical protein